jgi:hypothetical protein
LVSESCLFAQVARAWLWRWRSGGNQSAARWRCRAGNMRILLMWPVFVWILFYFPFLFFSFHDFICKKAIVFHLQCSQRLLQIAYLCCCPRKFGMILFVGTTKIQSDCMLGACNRQDSIILLNGSHSLSLLLWCDTANNSSAMSLYFVAFLLYWHMKYHIWGYYWIGIWKIIGRWCPVSRGLGYDKVVDSTFRKCSLALWTRLSSWTA